MKRSKDQDNTEVLKIRLAEKTMDLKIEAALEKVRVVALNMHEPSDMLKICKTISKQLQGLGVKEIRNVQTAIFYVSRGTYMNYEFYAKHDKSFITETTYGNNKIHHAFARKMLRDKGEFFVSHIRGDKVKKWIEYQKSTNVFIDRYLKTASSLNYYWHSLGPVALGISTYSPLSKEELDLFHRFIKVFDLAYRRFLDIEKAEKQAREAQTDVAVERVRAKALAMHQPEDIHEVVRTLRHELFGLNLEGIMGATLCLKQPDGQVRLWDITDIKTTGRYGWDILFDIKSIDPQLWVKKIWDSGKKITAIEQDSKDLRRALKWLSRYDKKTAGEITKLLKVNKIQHGWHRGVKLANGILITDFTKEPPVETESILLKIGAAFDLAYKRFLDLQKAEAQAREAKIQLSLERVRARTMAMHKSIELAETAQVLFDQLLELGSIPDRISIGVADEAKSVVNFWSTDQSGSHIDKGFSGRLNEPTVLSKTYKAWKENAKSLIIDLKGKELRSWIRFARDEMGILVKEDFIKARRVHTAAFFSHGWIMITTHEPPSSGTIQILERFASVFNLTYRRFLDLERAEAQAREAQIEAALERVRSSSMAMHQSSDLHQVIKVVTDQLCALRLKFDVANFAKVDETGNWDLWLSTPAQSYPAQLFVPYLDHPIFNRVLDMRKNQLDHISDVYDQKVKNVFFRHFFEKSNPNQFLESRKKLVLSRKGFSRTLFHFKNIWLAISNYDGIPFSDQDTEIFRRFAKAFEQSYIRFLDLQRAEAQAREAQIEAALERVRSRSMGIQKSDELKEVIQIVYDQMVQLKIPVEHTGFILDYKKRDDFNSWIADHLGSPSNVTIPYFEALYYHRFNEAKKKGQNFFAVHLSRKEKNKFYHDLFKHLPGFPEASKEFILKKPALTNSTALMDHVALYIENFSGTPYTDEENAILIRFGKVFQQTYTRFLDLQNAEVQAREAQIQLALERIRARTMAMQKSDELPETSLLLFQQMKELGLTAVQNSIGIVKEDAGVVELSTTVQGHPVPKTLYVPIDDPHVMAKAVAAWKKRRSSLTLEFHGRELKQYNKLRNRFLETKVNFPEDHWIVNIVFFSKGWLSFSSDKKIPGETLLLMERFAGVFDGTYTRFLDLQKAEAQAREAHIQLSLERVRARTMAMQKSDELPEAANLLFHQVQSLGMPAWSAGYCIWDEDKKAITLWMSSEGVLQRPFKLPLMEDPSCIHFLEAHQRGDSFFVEEIGGEALASHYQYMLSLPVVGEVLHSIIDAGHPLPTYQIFHCAYFTQGFLLFITYEPVNESHEIFKRFAKVFDQTYTRFLDLQKAEAQAREAQIEVAVERVRAQSMAMHHPDDLDKVNKEIFKQLTLLEIDGFTGVSIFLMERSGMTRAWDLSSPGNMSNPNSFSMSWDSSQYDIMGEPWRILNESNVDYFVLEYPIVRLKKGIQEWEKIAPAVAGVFKEAIARGTLTHQWNAFGRHAHGLLSIDLMVPPNVDTKAIVTKITSAFNLAYQRFLDLQKAEAQARDAQIEVSVERVRAKALAMHQSGEIMGVAVTMRKELDSLMIPGFDATTITLLQDDGTIKLWDNTSAKLHEEGTWENTEWVFRLEENHPDFYINRIWSKNEKYFVEEQNERDLTITIDQVRKFDKKMANVVKHYFKKNRIKHAWHPTVQLTHGRLNLDFYSPPGPEIEVILIKMGAAFDLAYKRFLDLQKAETQAKEAQIEAALERVRARAMAMHSSQELSEVVHELRKQMGLLGQKDLETCVIHLNEESSDFIHSWAAIRPPDGEGEILVDSTARVPKKGLRIIEEAMEAYSSNRQDYILLNEGDKLRQWFSFLENESPRSYSRLVESVQGKIEDLRAFWSFADFTGGSLLMVTMEAPDDATRGLLRKFANVFGLAYRRFADLKQAEAQAKEAEIQLALERVRARSLAMHHTSELQEVVNVTAQQLLGIGMDIDGGVFICINAEVDTGLSIWASGGMANYIEKIVVPVINKPIFTRIRDAIKKGNAFLMESFTDQEKWEFFTHLFQYEPWQSLSQERKEALLSRTGGFARSVVISRHTSISITNHHGKTFSEQENEVLKRFGKVFEQSYTRFLDLQKAEAQARESEIELGLERVRARAMAMQSSEELSTLIGTVFTELTKLDLALTRCIIWVFEPATHAARWWMANSEEPSRPMSFYIKYHEHPAYLTFVREWKNQNVKFVYDLKGQDKINWDDILFNETELSNVSDAVKNGMKAPERVLLSASFNNFGGINVASLEPLSNEHFDLLLRFAKVFDLTYTRFLDLKNAEAQAREAQVEAALERVRSQAMAMRQSGDLLDIVVTMRNEFTRLGHEAHYFWYMRWLPDKYEKAMTSGDGTRIGMIMSLPRHIHGDIPLVSHWEKSEEPALVYAMDGEAAINYVDKMVALGDFELVDPNAPTHDDIRHIEGLTFVMARTLHGEIGYSLPGVVSNPPEEDLKTLVRFANVFDLAYRRFEDLKEAEKRNRETQIELALERTRTKTMLMQHSDELLEISKVFHQQLLLLGIDSEFSFVWLPNEEKGDHLFWATWMQEKDGAAAFHTRAITYPLDLTEPYTAKCFVDWRSGVPVHEHFVAPENIETFFTSWEELLEGAEGLKPVFFPEGIFYTEAFMKYGCFGIDIRRPLSQQEQSILHRFAIEFERTYTRFLDLQRAEAQAKEAQIQLALERVRARTMAMHQSDELREVVSLLFEQIKGLGFEAFMCSILLVDESTRGYREFVSSDTQSVLPQIYNVPYMEDPFHDKIMAGFKEGLAYKVFELGGKEKKEYDKKTFTLTDFRFLPEETKQMMLNTLRCSICCAYMKHGCIAAIGDRELSAGHAMVLQRFAKVFDQTYIRFLDLEKAEAQAREAKIESALEKVRSRSLAMHKSDELKEVVVVVFEKLKDLGLTFDVAGIQLYTEGTRDLVQWVAAPGLVAAPVLANLPFVEEDFKDSEILQDIWAAKEQGKNISSKHYSFEEKNKFFAYAGRNNDLNRIPAVAREIQMKAPGYTQSLVAEKHSALWVDSYSGQTISEDEFNVLGRFARVFEQAYVRFLDLQKAEVQAREAQIEAALERVRSRSMGMQRGEDLKGVVKELYEQLKSLGFKLGVAAIQIIDPETGDTDVWMEGSEDGYELPEKYHVPYFDHPAQNRHLGHWKSGESYAVLEISGPDKKSYDRYFFFQTDFAKAPEQTKNFMMSQESLLTSMAYMKYGAIGWAPSELNKEQAVVLQRFAKVFEQTYTRFLDLQKAEAQAREAQIEASLERVRARTMAMHKSSELIETAELLFDQLKLLGAQSQGVAFAICDKDSTMVQKWTSIGVFSVPYTYEPGEQRMYEAWKNRQEIYEEVYEGDRIKEYYELLMQIPAFKEGIQKFIESGHPLPTWQKNHAVTFKYGYLLFITTEPFNETQIFLRFAKVFEQTYTRFLDLQKAEAQAREAQIEAALEKIRSRSLAMHKSDELKEVIASVFQRLKELALDFDAAAIQLFKEGSKDGVMWVASPDVISEPLLIHLPYDKDLLEHSEFFNSVWNARTRVEDIINRKYLFDEKNKYYAYVIKHNPQIPAGVGERMLRAPSYTHTVIMEKNSALIADSWYEKTLSLDDYTILKRFAKVFEQAYIRFLDLQKAEAQAREAQIEAALERVRSRSMGMQRGEDLKTVVKELYDQLRLLGFKWGAASITIMDEATGDIDWWMEGFEDGYHLPEKYHVPDFDHPGHKQQIDLWKAGSNYAVIEISGPEKKAYDNYYFFQTDFSRAPENTKNLMMSQESVNFSMAYMKYGALSWSPFRLDEEQAAIIQRFANVFEQTYTRFLDLQRAEAQAREAKIEASLERVRARTMAMHRSEELVEVSELLYNELRGLGVSRFINCGYVEIDEANNIQNAWMTVVDGSGVNAVRLPLTGEPVFDERYEAWKRKEKLFHQSVGGELLKRHIEFGTQHYRDTEIDEFVRTRFADPTIFYCSNFSQGYLHIITDALLSGQEELLLIRFTTVFDMTYKRFLDLQKAEAQGRESQIQLALERVRARTMAMQKSNELPEAANLLFQQVQSLGFPTWTAGYCIWDEDKKAITLWMSRPWGDIQPPFRVPLDENPSFIRYLEAHNKGLELYIEEISGKALEENYKYLLTLPVVGEQLESILAEGHPLPTYEVDHCAYFSKGFLLFITYQQVPEAHDIFKRFAKVFEQTYTRFLDLQKAEAQAREAQVEAALERVRSRSLAMHHSDELREIIGMVYIMLNDLKVKHDTIAIQVFDYETKSAVFWPRNTLQKEAPKVVFPYDERIMKEDTPHRDLWEAMATGEPILNKVYTKKQKNLWLEFIFVHNDYTVVEEHSREYLLQLEYLKICFFPERYSGLYAESWDGENYSGEDIDVLKRAARVFEQAYVRFLDLQKAEAQAREATIEASLERVRSKAMAMHNSQDLAATIQTFYRELNSLNLTPRRCGVGLIDRETRMAEVSTMNTTSDGESIEIIGTLVLKNHPVLEGVYEHWLSQEEYHPVLRGNEIREYYQLMRPQIQFPDYPQDAVQYGHFFFFDEGGVYAWTEKPLAEDELKIYRRFTSVLSLTYKRYRDLRNAEARAKEAVRQASLDRLRAEIASMRTAADLDRITPLIWKELTTLGIPFVRCGVFIMDEPNNQIHTYLSTPDGRAIAAFHLPLDNPGNLGEAVQYWREHMAYVTRWVDKDFQAQADLLAHLGAVDTRDQYLSNVPADGIYLHLSPFLHGMLYVGNTTPLSEVELDLVQSLSDAFSVAYARYDDFRQLEMAKKEVENALTGLKQAQQQLVQSEKMASLGELTAGIAHEIQNPLNFVNNFAEVNAELIDEIKQAVQAGNPTEVLHLAEDLKQNLVKINFHGKRADGIVKSMLQHSRSGDAGGKNKKEPTDLNKLAEEYLRLAYHGLRAKDKSFNASLHTDFDETVGLIEVSGQDLARAILNLINNAFYAVQDKEKQMKSRGEPFMPLVSLTTKRLGQTIEIRVKDNGPGIPEEVRDKIFQPFFTTKPTGQGTGLGLSLAYDIVKAHGGELKVDTTIGAGSEFIIQFSA